MISKNVLISFVVLLAGLTTGYFASKKEIIDPSSSITTRRLRDYFAVDSVQEYTTTSGNYQIELARFLAYYKQYITNYYQWIETGNARSKISYQLSMGQFKAVMKYYEKKYGENLVTPGMDFEEARKGLSLAENTGRSVRWARVVVVLSLFLLVLGFPGMVRDRANKRFAGTLYFDAIFRPSRIGINHAFHGTSRLALFLVALYVLSLIIFSSFTSLLFPIVVGGLGLTYVFTLALLINRGRNFRKILISLMAPKLLLMALILLIVAIRGPIYFWNLILTSERFITLFLSLFFMFLFRKFQTYVVLARIWIGGNAKASFARVFTTLGIQLLLVGLALLYFGLEYSLTAFKNDLILLPGSLFESILLIKF